MPLRSRQPIENDRAESAVLLVSPYPEDETFLRDVVNGFSFRLELSLDWRTARTGSPLSSFPVIITERDLPDASWENVFSDCERLLNLPRLIVISRLADERLWAEVLNRRGFDVLAKPFDRDEVTRVLGHALYRSNLLQRRVTVSKVSEQVHDASVLSHNYALAASPVHGNVVHRSRTPCLGTALILPANLRPQSGATAVQGRAATGEAARGFPGGARVAPCCGLTREAPARWRVNFMGRPPVGMWAEDISKTTTYLLSRPEVSGVAVMGFGVFRKAALCAAALDTRIAAAAVTTDALSYRQEATQIPETGAGQRAEDGRVGGALPLRWPFFRCHRQAEDGPLSFSKRLFVLLRCTSVPGKAVASLLSMPNAISPFMT